MFAVLGLWHFIMMHIVISLVTNSVKHLLIIIGHLCIFHEIVFKPFAHFTYYSYLFSFLLFCCCCCLGWQDLPRYFGLVLTQYVGRQPHPTPRDGIHALSLAGQWRCCSPELHQIHACLFIKLILRVLYSYSVLCDTWLILSPDLYLEYFLKGVFLTRRKV